MAAARWPTNADLIADVARLGHIDRGALTLDCTYGRGRWWVKWQPDRLVRTDLRQRGPKDQRPVDARADFRRLPFRDATFDAVAWDPPYVSVGGRATTRLVDFHDRYGMDDAPASPAALQAHNDEGMAEVARVVKPGGVILAKAQDYVSSGRLFLGTHYTLVNALDVVGLELVDRFEHITSPRPQPPRTRADGSPSVQAHARRNLSTLLVFRRPAARRRSLQPALFAREVA